MKKLVLFIVALAMSFSLIACGTDTEPADGASAPPAVEETVSE